MTVGFTIVSVYNNGFFKSEIDSYSADQLMRSFEKNRDSKKSVPNTLGGHTRLSALDSLFIDLPSLSVRSASSGLNFDLVC